MPRLSSEQAEFLSQHRVARLATVDDKSNPHVVPICFACAEDAIYTVIDEKPKSVRGAQLRRVRNILAHPDVCFLVDRYDDDWTRLAWLQVRGQARLVTEEGERATALALLRGRYPQYEQMDLESALLIRIQPDHVVDWAASPDHD